MLVVGDPFKGGKHLYSVSDINKFVLAIPVFFPINLYSVI